jgi:hypothetical protein
MNVIRAHDYRPQVEPDFKGLKRIMAGFIAATVLFFALTMWFVRRTIGTYHVTHNRAIHSCTCAALCSRMAHEAL